MGLNNTKSPIVYLSIGDGKVTKHLKEYAEGCVTYKTTKGDTKYRYEYESIDGLLKSVSVRPTEFNGVRTEKGQWSFLLESDGKLYSVNVPYSSGYAKYILNQLCNITDFSTPIRIKPWKFTPDDSPKPKAGCTVYYGEGFNTKGTPRWTKDSTDMPEMKKVKFKGQDSWDDTEQCEFYERAVAELITPHLPKMGVGHAVDEEVDDVVPF